MCYPVTVLRSACVSCKLPLEGMSDMVCHICVVCRPAPRLVATLPSLPRQVCTPAQNNPGMGRSIWSNRIGLNSSLDLKPLVSCSAAGDSAGMGHANCNAMSSLACNQSYEVAMAKDRCQSYVAYPPASLDCSCLQRVTRIVRTARLMSRGEASLPAVCLRLTSTVWVMQASLQSCC